MHNERLVPVTDEDISRAINRYPSGEVGELAIYRYVAEGTDRIEGEGQKDLIDFLQSIPGLLPVRDPIIFAGAAIFTYDLIPPHIKKAPLTIAQLSSTWESLIEHIVYPEGGEQPSLGVDWIEDKLNREGSEEDPSVYHQWLITMGGEIHNPDGRADFILGSILTFMPFYMREEARALERRLGFSDQS